MERPTKLLSSRNPRRKIRNLTTSVTVPTRPLSGPEVDRPAKETLNLSVQSTTGVKTKSNNRPSPHLSIQERLRNNSIPSPPITHREKTLSHQKLRRTSTRSASQCQSIEHQPLLRFEEPFPIMDLTLLEENR